MRLTCLFIFSLLSSCTSLPVSRPEKAACGNLPQCGSYAGKPVLVSICDPDPMCDLGFRFNIAKDFKPEHLDVLSLYSDRIKVPYRSGQQQKQANRYETICTAWK